MRSKFYLGILAAGLSLTALAAGCGDDVSSDDGTGAAGATGPGSGGTGNVGNEGGGGPGGAGPGGGGGTGTGGMGDGNDSCDQAEDAVLGGDVSGSIDANDDRDFFKLDLMEGQVIAIEVDAKPDEDPFADGFPDTVITLFDDTNAVIAVNDDPVPRSTQDSRLYTRAPKTGTYCLSIEDFCNWSPGSCPTRPRIAVPDYTIFIGEFNPDLENVTFGLNEPANDTPATAELLKYGKNQNGEYFASFVHGLFESGTDVDVYKLTVPTDDPTPLDPDQELSLQFAVFPTGSEGNGSTIATGNVWLTTVADPLTKLGEVDGTKVDPTFGIELQPDGVTAGGEYYLFVQPAQGSPVGSNPFYFLIHTWGGGNPIENSEATNDAIATPEPMTAGQTVGGGTAYFVAGNLADGDVDHYIIDNNAQPGQNMFATCAGQRIGSGVRGLKLEILDTTGATTLATATETADDNANLGDSGIPAPDPAMYPQLVLKITKSMQAPGIIGNYYNCGTGFFDP